MTSDFPLSKIGHQLYQNCISKIFRRNQCWQLSGVVVQVVGGCSGCSDDGSGSGGSGNNIGSSGGVQISRKQLFE